jgi:hypothetical protein
MGLPRGEVAGPGWEIKACCKSACLWAYKPPSPPAKGLRFRHQLHLVFIFAPLPGGIVACRPFEANPASVRLETHSKGDTVAKN